MAQDLGSAILAGIQGAQAMGQQRVRNQLAQDELAQGERRLGLLQRQVAIEEDTNRRAVEEARADQFVQSANAAGFLAQNMLSIDGDKLRKGIESGNRTAERFGLELVNRSGELPQGSVAEAIQPLPDGGYAITVRNKDGSKGVVTRDGSSNPDSEVVNFDASTLANLGNLYYQTQVVSKSSLINATIFRAQEGRVNADAAAAAARNEDELNIIARKNTVLNSLPRDGGARRAAASALASDESNQILDRLEADLVNSGAIQPRSNNQAPAAPSAPRTAPRTAPSTGQPPPSVTERAYSRVKSDPAALEAIGNGMNKNELTELYMYSLRQGDLDAGSRLEPYLSRRHGMTQQEIGSLRNQMANVRLATGERDPVGASIANAIMSAPSDVATALGFGERAAKERSERQAAIMADIRGTPSATASARPTRRNYTLNELSPTEKAAVGQHYRALGMIPENVFDMFDSAPLAKRKELFDLIDNGALKTNRAAIAIQDPAVRTEVRNISAAVSNRPTNAVDRDINAGRITVSPAVATAVSENLRSQGITNVSDLRLLNYRDQAIARAVILATEKDPNVRKQMSEEMSNIFETGNVSISGQQRATADIDRERNAIGRERNAIDRDSLNLRISELRRDLLKIGLERADKDIARTDKAVDAGATLIEGANKIFFGEDGTEKNLNRAAGARFTNSIMAPFMYRALNARTKPEGQALLTAMSPALSTTVAALAAEEEGGVIETLVSFFRADAVDTVSSTDFDLARVRVEKDSNGRPKRFFYTDERGAPVDEAVDAKALQDLNGQVYKLVLDAANYNSRGR